VRRPPERLIKGGLPTEAMVAYVLVAKYAWHLPLYRQAQMLLAQGIDIKRAVLAFRVGYAAAELMPFYLRLRELILGSAKIAIDETVVPVLDPGRGRTKKGYSGPSHATIDLGSGAIRLPLPIVMLRVGAPCML
jgi:transposase